jgi:tryptophan-rich sensory protein
MKRALPILALVAVAAALAVNYFSATIPFGGKQMGEVSESYKTTITPAGYAFSIWSLIYIWWLAHAIWQVLPQQLNNPKVQAAAPWLIMLAVSNAAWLPLFQYEYMGASVLVIICFVIALYFLLTIYDPRSSLSKAERWLASVPFQIYLGWITVATILNVAVWLVQVRGTADAPLWVPIGVLIVGMMIGELIYRRFPSLAYMLVLAWAYFAIYRETNEEMVGYVALAGAVLFISRGVYGSIAIPQKNKSLIGRVAKV